MSETSLSSPATPVICTITTRSHLALVRCLMDSFLRHHPSGEGYVLHVDGGPSVDVPHLTSIWVSDLKIPDLEGMRSRYSTFELCNSLKPFLMEHLLLTTTHEKLCYFDADIFLFGALDVWQELDACSVLLTPHLSAVPKPDQELVWRDLSVLQYGVFNGGFVGVRRTPETLEFLEWWSSRLIHAGYKRLEEGMNCDQRWLDLAPGLLPHLAIDRRPGLNAAYWNLHERFFESNAGRHFVNGEALQFFHFSGYSKDHPDVMTKNWTRFNFLNRPDLLPIFEEYRHHLEASSAPIVLSQQAKVVGDPAPGPPEPTDAADLFSNAVTVNEPTCSPLVTVVIPAHNAQRHIRQAIESVGQQTLRDIEIVVVNDGSTDETAAILESYGNSVRIVRQPKTGVSAARNRGIEEAQAEFVAFLDADDYFISPSKLADQLAYLEADPDLDVVHSGWRAVDESGKTVVERRPWTQSPVLDTRSWLLFQAVLPSAMMFRRNTLIDCGGFDTRLSQVEDVELALRLSLAGSKMRWLEDVTVAYRQHKDSASTLASEQARALGIVVDRFFSQPTLADEIRDLESEVRLNSLLWSACQLYRAGLFEEMERRLR
ncbi:MAG: glycosyltransferase, partial [Acidobacteriota bacterium]